jgi:hypothetical protein
MQVVFQLTMKKGAPGKYPYRFHITELLMVPAQGNMVMFPVRWGGQEDNVIMTVDEVIYEMPRSHEGALVARVLLREGGVSRGALKSLVSKKNTFSVWTKKR